LEKYSLRKTIIVYVKNEGSNFNAITNALTLIVGSKFIGLEESL
jgi:hypothetical protein